MLALHDLDLRRCTGCGGDLHETLGTESEDWIGVPPLQCGRCLNIAHQQDAFVGKHAHTYRWSARPGRNLRR